MTTVEIINELLQNKGVSASKMMSELGFSSGLYSQWKSGKQKPSRDKLEKIAEYFGVSVDYLLGNSSDTLQIYDEDHKPIVIDDETKDIIDSLRTNPEMKMLFSVTKKATKEDIIKAVKIIEALKDTGE